MRGEPWLEPSSNLANSKMSHSGKDSRSLICRLPVPRPPTNAFSPSPCAVSRGRNIFTPLVNCVHHPLRPVHTALHIRRCTVHYRRRTWNYTHLRQFLEPGGSGSGRVGRLLRAWRVARPFFVAMGLRRTWMSSWRKGANCIYYVHLL